MSVITDVFLKLKTVKGLVLEHPSTVKGSETLVKPARKHFYQIFSSLWGKLISKMSSLVVYEI